jgi:outer membrane immunogenic protein
MSSVQTFPPFRPILRSLRVRVTVGQTWFGTTRLRLGYQAFDRIMAYATGGIAYSGFTASISGTESDPVIAGGGVGTSNGSGHATRIGWAAGAGVEYAVAENLSFKTEYLYSQYSGFDVAYQRNLAADGLFADSTQGTLSTGTLGFHLVRAGLNWKLGN